MQPCVAGLIWDWNKLADLDASDVRAVDRDTLGPILFLLENSDIEVQRAASAALGNLAVNSTTPSLKDCSAKSC